MASAPSGRPLLVVLLVVGLRAAGGPPALAHNGALATAYPAPGIAVDGDLSDWPDRLTWYPVARTEYGDAPRDAHDCEAVFGVVCSPSADTLYLSLRVVDESVELGGSQAPAGRADLDWERRDGFELYLGLDHGEVDAPLLQFALRGEVPARSLGSPWPARERGELGWQRDGSGHHYEVALDIGELSKGMVRARPGTALALDVAVADADGSSSWISWG